MLSRRDFLKLGALVTASAALSSCAPADVYRRLAGDLPAMPWAPLREQDFVTLNRLSFGPHVEERAHFQKIGLQAWIEEQLDFQSIDDFDCDLLLNPFKTLTMDANELEAISNGLFDDYDRETIPNELRQATLMRQLYSRRQLYEVMTEFWPNFIEVKNVKKSKASDGFTFTWDYKMSGVRFEGKAETVEYLPYERLVIRSDKGLESTITWRFQPSGRGTHLMLKFDYQIPPALLKRTKEEIVLRENEHEVDAMLQNVKSILELQPAYA